MTFCINKECQRDCDRKRYNDLPRGITVSISDFGVNYKGEKIDFNECEYFTGGAE